MVQMPIMDKINRILILNTLMTCYQQSKISRHFIKLIFLLVIALYLIIIPSSSFAKSSKLKTKLSNFFQKIEKKMDNNSNENEKNTANTKSQIAKNQETTSAAATNNLKLEDFGFLPFEEVKNELLLTQKIAKNFDSNGIRFIGCQGFTSDGEYFYVALLSNGKENQKHTKVLKIRIEDLKIVKEQDLGIIGHTNSLTYNSKTNKIYTAPLWKEWRGIFEFDTDLNNLKKIELLDKDNSVIKDKMFKSVTYSSSLDQYIVKFDEYTLAYFDSNFKIIGTKRTKVRMAVTTTQALATDEVNLFSVTNDIAQKPFELKNNQILIYDFNGNYIDRYIFEDIMGRGEELEQIAFAKGKYYGMTFSKGNFKIYRLNLKTDNLN